MGIAALAPIGIAVVKASKDEHDYYNPHGGIAGATLVAGCGHAFAAEVAVMSGDDECFECARSNFL